MAIELWEEIRDAIISLLKLSSTEIGDNVRNGRTLPLSDPYGVVSIPEEDEMPLAIVSMNQVVFNEVGKTGSRNQHERQPQYDIDVYISQDRASAISEGITIDEYIDKKLDEIASQIVGAIEYYARFRQDSEDIPPELRLRGQCEMWVSQVRKDRIEQQNNSIIGFLSISVTGLYHKTPQFESVFSLDVLKQNIKTDTIEKEITIGVHFVNLEYMNANGDYIPLEYYLDGEYVPIGFYSIVP